MNGPCPAAEGVTAPWALGTFQAPYGPDFPGLVVHGRVLDLRSAGPDWPDTLAVLTDWDRAAAHLDRLAVLGSSTRGGTWYPLRMLRIRPPVRPGQILQSGANYRRHVIDLAMAEFRQAGRPDLDAALAETTAMMDRRAADGTPYIFLGSPGALTGAGEPVILPPDEDTHDWELELAAVIGRPARRVSPAGALDHVAGYTIANDITTRALVYRADLPKLGTDWFRAKNAPTFLPTGPFIVPAMYVDDPMDLRIELRLNGEVMQDEGTKDMIFDVARLVSACSAVTDLAPGDLVLTGSPAGNGAHHGRYLRPGDVMTGTVTGLGRLTNPCTGGTP